MSGKDDNLTQEEIWDDSALIDSWNDALEEYKKYHSIHAKGGSLKDLEALEMEKSKVKTEPKAESIESVSFAPPAPSRSNDTISSSQAPAAPPVHMLLGSVQDEGLKKLLMSWYYAGYYTGLYEGQQQAVQHDRQ